MAALLGMLRQRSSAGTGQVNGAPLMCMHSVRRMSCARDFCFMLTREPVVCEPKTHLYVAPCLISARSAEC